MFMQYPWMPEDGIRSPGTGVIYRQLWATMWVLEIEPESSGRTEVFLTAEPFLQPHSLFLRFIGGVAFICSSARLLPGNISL